MANELDTPDQATMAMEIPVDDQGNPIHAGMANMIATADGRVADLRPVTDRDIQMFVSDDLARNYEAIVAERHGGNWGALADRFEQEAKGEQVAGRSANVRSLMVLAAWARKQDHEATTPNRYAIVDPSDTGRADPAADQGAPDNGSTTPPKGRTKAAPETT